MSLGVIIAAAAVVGAVPITAPEVSHFPGSYFDGEARQALQRRAMERWPGPSQLVVRWRSGELDFREKMGVLLGASASHDPVLLPLYRDAVTSDNGRLRMAGAYGYRELLGDAIPNVAGGVDDASAAALAGEIDAVAATLRERPLVELWLQAVLAADGLSMPGWRGVVLRRPQGLSFLAVEQVVEFEDFRYLAAAYRIAERRSTRLSLLRLLEGITLQEFFVKPTDTRTGWGTEDLDEAFEAADRFVEYWLDVECSTDPGRILARSASALGAAGLDPLAPDSYGFWLGVLKLGASPWHMMAARQLYRFGGPWAQLSVLRDGSPQQTEERDRLIRWYRMLPAHVLARDRPAAQP